MSKITAFSVIEILGSPKEHVEKVVQMVIDKIKNENGIKLVGGKAYEAKKVKELWTSFAEVELEFEEMDKLVGFCFDYMPSSVDILEPDNININSGNFTQLLNDLLAKLHQYDMLAKNLRAENIVMKKKLDDN